MIDSPFSATDVTSRGVWCPIVEWKALKKCFTLDRPLRTAPRARERCSAKREGALEGALSSPDLWLPSSKTGLLTRYNSAA